MARTSKLTKDNPTATVTYPEDVEGPVTVRVNGGDEEPFTKKLKFDKQGEQPDDEQPEDPDQPDDEQPDEPENPDENPDEEQPPDDGDEEQPPEEGDIVVDAQQDESNPRKVTLTLKKVPGQDSGSEGGEAGDDTEQPPADEDNAEEPADEDTDGSQSGNAQRSGSQNRKSGQSGTKKKTTTNTSGGQR